MRTFVEGLECRPLDLRITRAQCHAIRDAATHAECARCPVGSVRLSEWLDEVRWPGGGRVLEVRFSREVLSDDGRAWPSREAYERELVGESEPPIDTDIEARVARWLEETTAIVAEPIEPIPKRGRREKRVRVSPPVDDVAAETEPDAAVEHEDERDPKPETHDPSPEERPNMTDKQPKKSWSEETKRSAAQQFAGGKKAANVAKAFGTSSTMVRHWAHSFGLIEKPEARVARAVAWLRSQAEPPRIAEFVAVIGHGFQPSHSLLVALGILRADAPTAKKKRLSRAELEAELEKLRTQLASNASNATSKPEAA